MAVMLDINYSKKLGLPNYSSHSLGIGLKAEDRTEADSG